MEDITNEYKILFMKPEGNIPLGKSRCRPRRHVNIKVDLKRQGMRCRLDLSGSVARTCEDNLKVYKPEVTNPQNCKKFVSHFIQLPKQRFILCQT
jgi:hypothetical protein